jgi:hypothetical protein
MAAPAAVISGAIAAAPALMAAPQAGQAPAQASSATVTTSLDAVTQAATHAFPERDGGWRQQGASRHDGTRRRRRHHHASPAATPVASPGATSAPTEPEDDGTPTAPGGASAAATPRGGGAPSSRGGAGGQSAQGSGRQAAPGGANGQAAPGGTTTQSTSSAVSSTVAGDLAKGNNLLAVGQFLVDHGYSKAAAAGIASCVDGESAGNPESVGSGGGGLIGWTPLSSAQPNANIVTGNPSQDMMTQLSDILFYNSSEIGQSLVNQLNSESDPVAAADFYSQNFEKPAVTNSDVRPAVAQQVFSELGG